MNLTAGQTVTTAQAGITTTVTGKLARVEGNWAFVTWTTATGRTVTGQFPLANTVAA